jgi:hypothetical protein
MRAAALIDRMGSGEGRGYVAQFVAGIARSAADDALAAAAGRLRADAGAAPALARLVAQRLRAAPDAFARG